MLPQNRYFPMTYRNMRYLVVLYWPIYIDVHSARARKVARKLRTIVHQIPITARWARSRSVFQSNPDHRIAVWKEKKKCASFRLCIPTTMDYLVAHRSFRTRSLRYLASFPIRAVRQNSDFWSFRSKISPFLGRVVTAVCHTVFRRSPRLLCLYLIAFNFPERDFSAKYSSFFIAKFF